MAGDADSAHPAGCFFRFPEKNRNTELVFRRKSIVLPVLSAPPRQLSALLRRGTACFYRTVRSFLCSPGLKSDILHGKTDLSVATSRFNAYLAVCTPTKNRQNSPIRHTRAYTSYYTPRENASVFLHFFKKILPIFRITARFLAVPQDIVFVPTPRPLRFVFIGYLGIKKFLFILYYYILNRTGGPFPTKLPPICGKRNG